MIRKIRDTIIGLWPILKTYMPTPRLVILLAVAFLIGLVWSYNLDKVVFFNADPSTLDQSWQDEIVRLAADRYEAKTINAAPSDELRQNVLALLKSIDNPQEVVSRLQQTSQPNVASLNDLAAEAELAAAKAPQPSIVASLRPFVVGPIVITVATVILSLLYGFYINPMVVEPIRKRLRGSQGKDAAGAAKIQDIKDAREIRAKLAEEAKAAPMSDLGPPVTQHVSIYAPGRAYDDSFGIEDAKKNNEFLGECGAVISETVGDDNVAAIEVWLFDKEDFVRTLTAVFVSEYAYNDPAIRARLEPKGELVLVKPGAIAILETTALRMQARIVDVAYGSGGNLPPNSYFEKLTIQLQNWRRAGGASAPVAAGVPATMPATPPMSAAPASKPFAPPPMPNTPPATASPFAPPPMPTTPVKPAPTYGSTSLPPAQAPSMPPPALPRRPPDDDPFGGTGDFTPVG